MRVCERCGTSLDAKRRGAKYCSESCRVRAYQIRRRVRADAAFALLVRQTRATLAEDLAEARRVAVEAARLIDGG